MEKRLRGSDLLNFKAWCSLQGHSNRYALAWTILGAVLLPPPWGLSFTFCLSLPIFLSVVEHAIFYPLAQARFLSGLWHGSGAKLKIWQTAKNYLGLDFLSGSRGDTVLGRQIWGFIVSPGKIHKSLFWDEICQHGHWIMWWGWESLLEG